MRHLLFLISGIFFFQLPCSLAQLPASVVNCRSLYATQPPACDYAAIARQLNINRDAIGGMYCCLDAGGNLYVTWTTEKGLLFQRLNYTDKAWLPEEKLLVSIKSSMTFKVDNTELYTFPAIACDISRGEYNGRLYICWSDSKFSETDRDVFLIYSDDKGATWTEPILVTYNPNHKAQFMPCMAVDNRSGQLYLMYYDKQNYAKGKLTDISLAISKNGGLKFDYYKVNDKSFSLANYACEALLEIIPSHPIRLNWMQEDARENELCYTATLSDDTWQVYYKTLARQHQPLEISKTFVFSEKMKIPFHLDTITAITAVLTKPLDPAFEKVLIKNKTYKKGDNALLIDAKRSGVEKGNYTLILYYNATNRFIWITEE